MSSAAANDGGRVQSLLDPHEIDERLYSQIHGVCEVMELDGMDPDERREVLSGWIDHTWCTIAPLMNVRPEDIRGIYSDPRD